MVTMDGPGGTICSTIYSPDHLRRDTTAKCPSKRSCSEEQCKDLSYSHMTVTAGGVGAQLFRRRYASVAQIRP